MPDVPWGHTFTEFDDLGAFGSVAAITNFINALNERLPWAGIGKLSLYHADEATVGGTAKASGSDLSVAPDDDKIVSSASFKFSPQWVSKLIDIQAGEGGWTAGSYGIVSVDDDGRATLSTSPAPAGATGGAWSLEVAGILDASHGGLLATTDDVHLWGPTGVLRVEDASGNLAEWVWYASKSTTDGTTTFVIPATSRGIYSTGPVPIGNGKKLKRLMDDANAPLGVSSPVGWHALQQLCLVLTNSFLDTAYGFQVVDIGNPKTGIGQWGFSARALSATLGPEQFTRKYHREIKTLTDDGEEGQIAMLVGTVGTYNVTGTNLTTNAGDGKKVSSPLLHATPGVVGGDFEITQNTNGWFPGTYTITAVSGTTYTLDREAAPPGKTDGFFKFGENQFSCRLFKYTSGAWMPETEATEADVITAHGMAQANDIAGPWIPNDLYAFIRKLVSPIAFSSGWSPNGVTINGGASEVPYAEPSLFDPGRPESFYTWVNACQTATRTRYLAMWGTNGSSGNLGSFPQWTWSGATITSDAKPQRLRLGTTSGTTTANRFQFVPPAGTTVGYDATFYFVVRSFAWSAVSFQPPYSEAFNGLGASVTPGIRTSEDVNNLGPGQTATSSLKNESTAAPQPDPYEGVSFPGSPTVTSWGWSMEGAVMIFPRWQYP